MAYTPIDNSEEHFKPVTYTGNSTEPRNIDVGFQTDFTWVKDRTIAYYHRAFDSTRGGAPIYPSETSPQDHHNDGPELDFSSPYSNGFKIVDNPDGTTNSYGVNQNSSEIISWNWKCNGGTTSTNTSGSINSTVQVNSDAGFSIVAYTGTGTAMTIGHGLSAAPNFTIVKDRSNAANWIAYYDVDDGSLDYMFPNAYNGGSNSSLTGPNSSIWNFSASDSVWLATTENEEYNKFKKGNTNRISLCDLIQDEYRCIRKSL